MIKITVIGLGLMGSALARLLVAAGHQVTVWNVMPRLDAAPGAAVAGHLETAIAASPVILICVRDITIARSALDTLADVSILTDKTVVNLSSGSPADAQNMANWLAHLGCEFLDGAIMNNPEEMGKPGSRILMAGHANMQASLQPVMKCLACDIRNVGANFRAAKATYQAFEMIYFGHLAASLHAANICMSEGIDLGHLMALHERDPSYQGFIGSLIDGHFRAPNTTLETWATDLSLIRKQAVEAGIASPFPDFLARYFDRAIAAGYGQDDVMAIWKTLT